MQSQASVYVYMYMYYKFRDVNNAPALHSCARPKTAFAVYVCVYV